MPRLYLISDRTLVDDFLDSVEKAFRFGIRMFQLREKDLLCDSFYYLALKIRKMANFYNVRFIINSRIDIAMDLMADGLHINKSILDLNSIDFFKKKVYLFKKKFKRDFLLFYSAHSLKEIYFMDRAGIDAVTISPIFFTNSKPYCSDLKGVNFLKKIPDDITMPIFALGGIKLSNLENVLGSSVYGVAMVSEIFSSSDYQKTITRILRTINLPETGLEPAQNFFY